MKPKNFPGRRNRRRMRALEHLYDSLDNPQAGFTKEGQPRRVYIETQIAILESRVVSQESARAIRTKKRRSA